MQQAMARLKKRAVEVLASEEENDHLPLMRAFAAELQIDADIKDSDLGSYLEAAERAQNPVTVYRAGDKLQATQSVFLLEGLVKLGEANVIVGQPKVGKSSFSTGLIAAIRDRRDKFLGRDLMLPGERMPVLIFGTDQSEGDWLHFLEREQLVESDMSVSKVVDFFCSMESGEHFNFTKAGIKAMREEIEKHQFPLVIIDSLSSMMEPTGLDENTSSFARPIRRAISELKKTGATLVFIHHSVKRPSTWDWIQECRGSSSISSVFSWGVLMRWVAQEEDGLMRVDRRVGFAGKGRGSGDSGGVMGRYEVEGGWAFLDGLENAQQVERVKQRIYDLGGVRAQVFDYLTLRREAGADVCCDELANELNKTRTNMSREIKNLGSKGLVDVTRLEPTGSRPRPYYSLSEPAAEAMGLAASHAGGHSNELSDSFGFFSEKDSLESRNSTLREEETASLKESVPIDSKDSKESLPTGTRVERLLNGQWQPGWIVHDGSNLDAVTVQKFGNVNIVIRNLRWQIDLRHQPVPGSPQKGDTVEVRNTGPNPSQNGWQPGEWKTAVVSDVWAKGDQLMITADSTHFRWGPDAREPQPTVDLDNLPF